MVNVSSIGSYIREQREQAKISIRQLAQAAGVSNPYLSQVERGLRRPSADICTPVSGPSHMIPHSPHDALICDAPWAALV